MENTEHLLMGNMLFDPTIEIQGRLGQAAADLGVSGTGETCPEILELVDHHAILVVGTDVTDSYRSRLPDGTSCAEHERIIAIPVITFGSAVEDYQQRQKPFPTVE